MTRKHALIVSLILGVVAGVGTAAAVRTAQLGQAGNPSSPKAKSAQLTRRARLLDRQQAALEHALARRPPKLPKVPAFPATRPAGAQAPAPGVRFVRPAAIVVVTHRSHGDDDHGELEHEGGDD